MNNKPSRGLMSDPYFLIVLLVGLIAQAYLIYQTMGANNLSWKPIYTKDGFNLLQNIFSFHIKLFGAWLATLGLIAAIFRSKQTAEQIQIADQNNRFNNYISHEKYFLEHLEKIEKRKSVKFRDARFLYQQVFPDSNFTNGAADQLKTNAFLRSCLEQIHDTHLETTMRGKWRSYAHNPESVANKLKMELPENIVSIEKRINPKALDQHATQDQQLENLENSYNANALVLSVVKSIVEFSRTIDLANEIQLTIDAIAIVQTDLFGFIHSGERQAIELKVD